jgi:chloramphenicol-sensitive protein RarD
MNLEARRGVGFGFAAFFLWGMFPLYFRLLDASGSFEILLHRILWSLLVLLLVALATRAARHDLRAVLARPRVVAALSAAALAIALNWGIYIYAVNSGQVVEAALGYYINPLVTVALGVVVLGERLRPAQWAAVAVAAAAVTVLTVDYGRPPWIALSLAFTFGLYGVMKKLVRVEAAPGLFLETAIVALPALVVLGVLHGQGDGHFGNVGALHTVLLVVSGVATAVPLLLFAAAARRIPLSTVGLLQYLTPCMHLTIGVFVYGEPMPPVRLVGFALVWAALAVFTADSLRHARAGVRRADAEAVPAGL